MNEMVDSRWISWKKTRNPVKFLTKLFVQVYVNILQRSSRMRSPIGQLLLLTGFLFHSGIYIISFHKKLRLLFADIIQQVRPKTC